MKHAFLFAAVSSSLFRSRAELERAYQLKPTPKTVAWISRREQDTACSGIKRAYVRTGI